MKSVKEIVVDYLRKIGADGLCNPGSCCGCGLDDFVPCGADMADCVPAKRVPVPEEEQGDYDEWYEAIK